MLDTSTDSGTVAPSGITQLGRRHRYGYTTAGTIDLLTLDRDAVLRHDMDHATTTRHPLPEQHRAGEFSFIPTSEQSAEDDGILMGFVYDESTGRSNLTLLHAATLDTIATVHLPTRVPYGFHGNWIPSDH